MRHRAVGLWAGFLMLGATALLGAVLLVSGPAAAATCPPYGPCTQPTTVTPTTVAPANPVVSPGSSLRRLAPPQPLLRRLHRRRARADVHHWRHRHRGGRHACSGEPPAALRAGVCARRGRSSAKPATSSRSSRRPNRAGAERYRRSCPWPVTSSSSAPVAWGKRWPTSFGLRHPTAPAGG